jgi:hypothetical protein
MFIVSLLVGGGSKEGFKTEGCNQEENIHWLFPRVIS